VLLNPVPPALQAVVLEAAVLQYVALAALEAAVLDTYYFWWGFSAA
jgi:hypothetical protein